IADGEIVAYRINDRYPHLQFADGKWAAYSTGFVLVRHHLALPPAPNSTGPQPADEKQDVYSLYLHMADWSTYLADEKLRRPFWWDVDAFRVLGKDHQHPAPGSDAPAAAGAFVWTEPKAGSKRGRFTAGKQVGFLPEGCEIIVGEKRGAWGHIQSITMGGMISPTAGETFGSEDRNVPWEAPDGTPNAPTTPKDDWGWISLRGHQPTKEPKQLDQVVIPVTPIPVKAGTPLGQLGEYHDYERATPLPPIARRQILHLEVFTDDGFSAFLAKSRSRAALLPADQRGLLVINSGAKLVQAIPAADRKLRLYRAVKKVEPTADSPTDGPWVKVQPMCLDSMGIVYQFDGPPVWIEREKLASVGDDTPAWSRFPLGLQGVADPANGFPLILPRGQLDALEAKDKATDDQKVNWWHVPFSTADGKNAWGWVCEKQHPGTKWESPWAWPGFETVDATGIQIADAFRRNLVITGAADWKEQKEFEPSLAAVNNSPLLLKLEQAVAKLGTGDGKNKGKVTARAIQSAMRVPSLAQALSHVILRYASEWGGDMGRWNSITPLMRNARDNWLRELERIKKLQWWDDVKGKVAGFPASPTVLHIHPIALISNFQSSGTLSCAHCGTDLRIAPEILKKIFPSISERDANGFPAELNSAFLKYKINTCNRISHFFGQCEVECGGFTEFRESLRYSDGGRLWRIYNTALRNGLHRLHSDWTVAQMETYTKAHLVNNDSELGVVLFGDDAYPNRDYRGRGLLHLTWLASYSEYKQATGLDIISNPALVESNWHATTDSSAWFWSSRRINPLADANNPKGVTKIINPALKDLERRKAAARRAFEIINKGGQPCKHDWDATITGANGW
uniref:glycoside hydrolase family 19 protein n=1 Tax=Cupriavidus necator TaxID=106590 RepID=UPI00339D9E23